MFTDAEVWAFTALGIALLALIVAVGAAVS